MHSESSHLQTEPVTVLFDRTVRAGHEADYKRWYRQLIRLSEQSPGHISTHVIEHGRRFLTMQQFANRAALDTWLDSNERKAQLGKLAELAEQAPEPRALSGLEPWFELPNQPAVKPVPKWKMALVTFCVIYTLVTILSYTAMPFIVNWPVPLRSVVFPAVMVPLMTYLIMPHLSRLLKTWLHK